MNLYESWFKKAYTQDGRTNNAFWNDFMPKEQKIYEYILNEIIFILGVFMKTTIRVTKLIAGGIEVLLGISVLGASIILGLAWIPLWLC